MTTNTKSLIDTFGSAQKTEDHGFKQSTTTCFDQLVPSLIAMKTKLGTMNEQLHQLNTVDESLSQFNDAFGAFLFGLAANGATTRWPVNFGPHDTPPPAVLETMPSKQDDPAPTKKTQKAAKFVTKINIRKIIDRLPLKYREQTEPMKTMETTLRALRLKPSGMTMDTLVQQIGIPKYKVTECLNALIRSKDVIKHNPRGQLAIYQLDPARYPSS